MEDLFSLISKFTNKKITNKHDFTELKESNFYVYYFFSFLEKNENLIIFKEILFNVRYSLKPFYAKKILNKLNINEDDYCKLQSIFVLKSLKKSNFEMISDIDKLTTIDDVLNNHLKFEKKYWIFEKNELYPFCGSFKKELFRVYSLLAIRQIIKEKIINNGVKTHKQWILDYEDFENSEIEKFKISFKPFKIVEINDRFFMISDFFTLTTEIFKENIKSLKRFNLKEKRYLEELCQIALYFDEKSFDRIYLRKLKQRDIRVEIKNCFDKIKKINQEIDILTNLSKTEYINKFKIKIKKDILDLKEMNVLIPFKKYSLRWLKETFKEEISFYALEKIWKTVLNDLTEKKYELLDESWFLNYLKNNELKFFDILQNQSFEVSINKELLESDINNFIEEFYKKIINIYKNLNLSDEIKFEYRIEMDDVRKLKNNQIKIYSELSELYQLNNLELIKSIKNKLMNKKIYFPLFYDFRGRMYIHSSIGVTNFKLSRYFMHYGWYENDEIKFYNKINIPEIHKHNNTIEIVKKKWGITKTFNCINEAIFWCLMGIGKEFIDKNKICNLTEEILTKGVEKLVEVNNELDDEKWIIVEHYKNIIESFKNEKICKRIILKDATASFIQNAIRIIGPKNEISLEYANLKNSDKWYDTYTLALEFWKKTLIIKNDKIEIEIKRKNVKETRIIDLIELNYFIRKTIKKPIMTDAYEASYLRKWEYFKDSVKLEFGKNFEFNSDVEYLFKNFTEFLDNNFWDKHFLYDNSDTMVKYVKNMIESKKNAIISSTDSESNMIYYKFKDKVIDVTVSIPNSEIKHRKTKKILIINENEIDTKKIILAIKPNWVHFSDAYLIRQINALLKEPLLSVHDCFLVDCLNVSNFILKANKAFKSLDSFSIAKNRDIINKIRSIFIFF